MTVMAGFAQRSAVAIAALFGVLAAAGAGAAPVFTVGLGVDILSGGLAVTSDAQPVNGSYTQRQNDPFGNPGKELDGSVSADRGRIRVTNTVRLRSPHVLAATETLGTFRGDIYLCAEGSQVSTGPGDFDPSGCTRPDNPAAVPIPFPNIFISGTASSGGGSSTVIVTTRVDGSTVYARSSSFSATSGDEAGTLADVTTAQNTGAVRFKDCSTAATCKVVIEQKVDVTNGCGFFTNCTSTVNMGNSVNFSETGFAFVDVAPGISIWSPDLNIYDNRWYAPEFFLAAAAPEPGAALIFAVGILGLGALHRRGIAAVHSRARAPCSTKKLVGEKSEK